ncbi:MAG: 50S ribosomal protein L6 [candidate division WOR-3 bacterium]|nr:50S ribosomal protein L6 [candidate division WOR-3 bacterium]MCX7757536.1 50S ribosomal protein L6 [candidate division WOR-3 bacterium]MDW7987685.1 50S ribosomal protein L6 [candidate division WOR-3 bacterium]
MAKRFRPIPIPEGVTVNINNDLVVVKGKLGELKLTLHPTIAAHIENNEIVLTEKKPNSRMFLGTMQALIKNMITGVTQGFTKVLEVRGMGYRVQKTKEGIQLYVGFIHPVDVPIPEGITAEVTQAPNPDEPKEQMFQITIKGIDKQLVGQVAATIRAVKPPDVYHGKGIRYQGEYVRKKAGKRAIAAQA